MMLFNRRAFGWAAAATLALPPTIVSAQEACTTLDPARQKSLTPDEVLQALKDGNARFLSGRMERCDLLAQVRSTAGRQSPMAAIVGCIDSRVPPELIFDQHIGDIFCARIAGNFVNADILGSLEFATKVAGAKAVLVLGHTGCGAVAGAIDNVQMGNLTAMLANIEPAIAAAGPGERSSADAAFFARAVEANVRLAISALTERSDIMRDSVASGALKIAGAVHDISTGSVRFL